MYLHLQKRYYLDHSDLMPFITILSAYRYIQIFCFFIVLHDDACAIVFIFICKMAYVAPFQGSYLLIFCSYLTLTTYILILDGLYLIFTVGSFSSMTCPCFSWISLILAPNPRGTMSFRMCFLSALPLPFREFQMT